MSQSASKPLRLEGLGYALRLVARVAEDDGALGVFHFENSHELADLVALPQYVDEVRDLERADLVARERDELRIAQMRLRESLDVRRQSRAEKQALAVLRQRLEDRVELAREAHGEHLVRLVEDQNLDRGRVEGFLA